MSNKLLIIPLILGLFLVAGIGLASAYGYGYTDTYYKQVSYDGYGGKHIEIVRDTPYKTYSSTTTNRPHAYTAYNYGYHPSLYYSSYNRLGGYLRGGSYYNVGFSGARYDYYPRYSHSYSYPTSNYYPTYRY